MEGNSLGYECPPASACPEAIHLRVGRGSEDVGSSVDKGT